MTNAEIRQRAYYQRTASEYDACHDEPEHRRALAHIVEDLKRVEAKTVLDTGCGTGRGLVYLKHHLPMLELRGNDPSEAMLEMAAQRGVPRDRLDLCPSESLPYPAASFDAVIALGVLHHVPDPSAVLKEMIRVARVAIFISDCNIYSQGSMSARIIKLGLARTGLLRPFNWIRRGGKLWYESEGDGVAYSYSVFDSITLLKRESLQVSIVPTNSDADDRGRGSLLLHAQHALVCGLKPKPSI